MVTPRCIVVRHGQTEWSKNGNFTGVSDIPLTQYGISQVHATANALFEDPEAPTYLDPNHVTYIFTSPRSRATHTKDIFLEHIPEKHRSQIKVIVDDDLREWEYGDYEGKLTHEIIALRKSRGLDQEKPWNIWRDGCENGETTEQVGCRLSHVIARIQHIHSIHLNQNKPCDILVFAHGHTLRYFSSLWFMSMFSSGIVQNKLVSTNFKPQTNYVGFQNITKEEAERDVPFVALEKFYYLNDNPWFMLDAGGVAALSYSHNKISEPSLMLSGIFNPRATK
ncbi:hypothetical protein ACO0RG_000242 [Hanseniaspora osmophila]|uniref:Sedoheptulose 1,7-bisphosphatase n=1 Tax=Hanseniaspora osmophila TaxID=56408 RepID=A0A1E5R554_9ASCO|nr:Sedoheptulose 1,7-bisphosphatase [Hanseniaspora osmophila]